MSNQTKWAKDFAKISSEPPAPGTILKTFDDSPAKLTIELKKGASPFIFGRAYVSDLFDEELGWFLQGADNDSFHGFKCILLPRARTDLIQKFGLGDAQEGMENNIIFVQSLQVIRYSHSGSSILCEVHEYLEEEVGVKRIEGDSTMTSIEDLDMIDSRNIPDLDDNQASVPE